MNPIFRKANILIVEDESLVAADVSMTLNRLGHNVNGIVSKGIDALKFIEKMKPDLVLMDITLLGEMDGIETAAIINDKYSIPVVFVTAHDDKDTIEKTKVTNPYGYVTKPIDDIDLFSTINTALYRHDSEQKFFRVEEKYFRLTENALDMILSMNIHDSKINYINKACFNITGYLPEEFYSNPDLFESIILPEWRDFYTSYKKNKIEGQLSQAIEYKIRHKSGEYKWLNQRSVVSYNKSGEAETIEAIVTDFTLRKKNEDALENSVKKLSALRAHLETVREEERKHLSREIHDQLGQDLTVLKIGINMTGKQILNRKNACEIHPIIGEFVGESNETIDRLVVTIRNIASELRPDILDRLGLKDAIEWNAYEFQRKTKINCSMKVDDVNELLSLDDSVMLYRIFQEILTNVLRHSKADNVDIVLENKDDGLILNIKDNGIGISPEQIENSKSLGIFGMQERVKMLGGTCEITSSNGNGANIEIKIPKLINVADLT